MNDRSMHPYRIRAIFAFVAALLAVQVMFTKLHGEPYPAIIMPGFAGGHRGGPLSLERYDAVFIADGEEFVFRPQELLAEFPDSMHRAISGVLKPGRESVTSKGGRLARIRDAIFPGFAAGRTDSPEKAASLRDWLKRRSQALLPGRDVARVEIRWRTDTLSRDDGQTSTPGQTLIVDLGET